MSQACITREPLRRPDKRRFEHPRRMERAAQQPRLDRDARFEDLPDEMLEKIVAYVDNRTLDALSKMNSRLKRVSLREQGFRTFSIKCKTDSIVKKLRIMASRVRCIDLSNFRGSLTDLESLIRSCPNLQELNTINSGLRSLEPLSQLRKLETLCMNALKGPNDSVSNFREVLASIKNLYLEILPPPAGLKFTTTVLNLCEAIEFVHINLSGFSSHMYRYEGTPVKAERWKTLNTFICTQHMSNRHFTKPLLGNIFAFNETPGILEWIDQDRDCYIYEKGFLNGYFPRSIEVVGNVKYLKEVHEARLTTDGDIESGLKSPYGHAASVRIKGFYGFPERFLGRPLLALTELDINRCHSAFQNDFRLSLLALLPSLESFACSLCFMIHESARNPAATEIPPQQKIFNEALERLKLKELRVDGLTRCEDCSGSSCACSQLIASQCAACNSEIPLTARNLVDLSSFNDLQRLTLAGVTLHASAFGNLVNSNVKTVRLCLNMGNNYSGLRNFMQRCGKLERLKLEGLDLPITYSPVWRDLAEASHLKQLCLRMRHGRFSDPAFTDEVFNCLARIVERVDLMHLHCASKRLTNSLRERLRRQFGNEKVARCFHLGYETFNGRQILNCSRDARLPEQGLCLGESNIGVVPPLGWAIGQ